MAGSTRGTSGRGAGSAAGQGSSSSSSSSSSSNPSLPEGLALAALDVDAAPADQLSLIEDQLTQLLCRLRPALSQQQWRAMVVQQEELFEQAAGEPGGSMEQHLPRLRSKYVYLQGALLGGQLDAVLRSLQGLLAVAGTPGQL